MKIIFSRKGFDSSSGGAASPILPDDQLVSLPIPSKEDNISFDELSLERPYNDLRSYKDLMEELGIKLDPDDSCHLDPDLRQNVIKRQSGWLPNFGQLSGPQTQLMNQGVKKDDLFLFFGWFKKTDEMKNGKLAYIREKFADLHVLYGYLEIGEILRINQKKDIKPWLEYHPHCLPRRMKTKNNTIYVATEKLSWNDKLPGGGILKFHKDLILTEEGRSRSHWRLSREDFPGLWSNTNKFKPGYRGQEFVIHANGKTSDWAKKLISDHAKS